MRNIREADVEAYLVMKVALHGGVAEKFTSPNRTAVPDRLVQWPAIPSIRVPAEVCFVECKAPGKKPTAAQERDHDRRRVRGFRVYTVDSYESVDNFLASEGFQ